MSTNSSKSKQRVLLYDDSAFSLDVQWDLLADAGFEVRGVSAATDLAEALEEFPADAVLIDVHGPEVTGAAICQDLKRGRYGRPLPVVLCSPLAEARLSRLGEQCGADAVVSGGALDLGERVRRVVAAVCAS